MPDNDRPTDAQTPVKADGPYTPLESPLETGHQSGGEYQFSHSTAEPRK
jgi:hypothetical protein